MGNEHIIEVENLKTYFHTPEGIVKSVDGVSFAIERGKTMALVGESGCGKTQTSLSLIRLLAPTARVSADKLMIDGKETKEYTKEQARTIRGKDISMIFQEPMTSLNPVYRIKRQLEEMISLHQPELGKTEVYEKAIDILEKVGIPDPKERIRVFPHQLSGGLRQRVMIAIALASSPKLLIADEPTTALDVTIQAQIIELLKEIQKEMQMSILLITHDFGVVSQMADSVSVMYAGKIVEQGPMKEVFEDPWHPYTKLLILSIPGIKVKRGGRLETIDGAVPNPLNFPPGCRFYPRCPYAGERCKREEPPAEKIGDRVVSCFKSKGGNRA